MSAYQQMKQVLTDLLPEGWKLTDHEPILDLPDVTSVTMKIRSVEPLPAAPLGCYAIDWVLTITTPLKSRKSADPTLFDELIQFLGAIDSDDAPEWFTWTEATKAAGDDGERLAYDITVRHHTNRETDAPEDGAD